MSGMLSMLVISSYVKFCSPLFKVFCKINEPVTFIVFYINLIDPMQLLLINSLPLVTVGCIVEKNPTLLSQGY